MLNSSVVVRDMMVKLQPLLFGCGWWKLRSADVAPLNLFSRFLERAQI